MEAIRSLERKVAEVHKDLPHLPAQARRWLVVNAWWLVLIGVVLSAMSLLAAFNLLISLSMAVSGMNGIGVPYMPFIGISVVGSWISFFSGLAVVIVLAISISPLRAQLIKGWNLLFVAALVALAGGVVGAIFGNFFAIFGLAIGTAIGWYFLFEVRDEFDGVSVDTPVVNPADAPKKNET